MDYKLSFKLVSESGAKIEIKLINPVSAKNAQALFSNSLSVLDGDASKDELDEFENEDDDEDEDEDEDEDHNDDSPDLSSFENKSLSSKFPGEQELTLRIIHHDPDRIEDLTSLLEDKLKISSTQAYETIANKEDVGPLPIELADPLFEELRKMGVGVSIKKPSYDQKLYNDEIAS